MEMRYTLVFPIPDLAWQSTSLLAELVISGMTMYCTSLGKWKPQDLIPDSTFSLSIRSPQVAKLLRPRSFLRTKGLMSYSSSSLRRGFSASFSFYIVV